MIIKHFCIFIWFTVSHLSISFISFFWSSFYFCYLGLCLYTHLVACPFSWAVLNTENHLIYRKPLFKHRKSPYICRKPHIFRQYMIVHGITWIFLVWHEFWNKMNLTIARPGHYGLRGTINICLCGKVHCPMVSWTCPWCPNIDINVHGAPSSEYISF